MADNEKNLGNKLLGEAVEGSAMAFVLKFLMGDGFSGKGTTSHLPMDQLLHVEAVRDTRAAEHLAQAEEEHARVKAEPLPLMLVVVVLGLITVFLFTIDWWGWGTMSLIGLALYLVHRTVGMRAAYTGAATRAPSAWASTKQLAGQASGGASRLGSQIAGGASSLARRTTSLVIPDWVKWAALGFVTAIVGGLGLAYWVIHN